jgi:hypothetical protein
VACKLSTIQGNKKLVVLPLLPGQGREGCSIGFDVGNLGINWLAWPDRSSLGVYVNTLE